MNEKIEILRYTQIDANFSKLVDLHKEISENNNLNNLLIYYDSNFPEYFKKIVEESDVDCVFVVCINNILCGFIHYKIIKDTIFLNNVCVSSDCQGRGVGKFLIRESLSLVNKTNLYFFELDVFLSNKKALLWYQDLGLKLINKSYWKKVKLKKAQKCKPNLGDVLLKKDDNGFNSIYYEDIKIATIVKDSVIILHDINLLKYVEHFNLSIIIKENIKIIFGESYEFKNLEIAGRMKCKLENVINKLS